MRSDFTLILIQPSLSNLFLKQYVNYMLIFSNGHHIEEEEEEKTLSKAICI